MRSPALLATVLVGIVVVACSGAKDSELFDSPTTSTKTSDAGATTGTVKDSGGATTGATTGVTNGSTNGATTGATNGTATGATNGATTGATTGATNGTSNGADTGPTEPPDAGPPPVTKTTYCGDDGNGSTLECADPEVCCVDRVNGDPSFACAAASDCNAIVVKCHLPSDCDTGVCCGTLQGNSWTTVECSATCTSSANASTDRTEMCDPTDPTAATCPAARRFCNQSAQLPGFGYCSATP